MIRKGATFSSYVFTDECTVQIDCSTRFCYVKPGDQFSSFRNRAKHPAKVHIWGGISSRGQHRLPYFRKTEESIDNAPPHKSRYTTAKQKEWNIEAVQWPPESPDLNPIEMLWGNMKNI
ncbi:hypothetical protein OSTOST_03537, partial [Ostertagia ostertagi]